MSGSGMKQTVTIVFLVIFLLGLGAAGWAQQLKEYKGSELYRAKNWHTGNKVGTIFYNYGLVANVGEQSGEWPLGTGDEYVGDVTPLVGIEFVHPGGDTVRSVITCLGPRSGNEYNQDGTFSGFEPLPGFTADPLPNEDRLVAMSHEDETWPSFWPDRRYDDPKDQLWAAQTDLGWPGSWNGYFGKNVFNADQESFFIMDDTNDREFQDWPPSNPVRYYPVFEDTTRGGLGIRVAARGFQWAHFLAEDCLIWHYEITNVSDYDYDKVVFGMVVGTLSGGRNDSEDDLAFFDPDNDITYSWDSDDQVSGQWVPVREGEINVGYAGYAFLESPGNAYDGIDNDGDSQNSDSPVLNSLYLTECTSTGLSYGTGDELVLIDYNTYERTVTTMPASGQLMYMVRDDTFYVSANESYVEDGVNGIDDNFNGLIDERLGEEVNGKRLDHLNLKYKNYFTGEGVDDPMIDEARDDGIDNDGDWDPTVDDVGADGQGGTGDEGENDGVPTYGEPHFDRTDINESDQIGLTSFEYFSPPGNLRMNNDDGLWEKMLPGYIDVVPNLAQDGDFVYGSGYFPLPSGKTERFSVALFFGEDLEDITNNKITVQQIYDNNYNFVRPPEKPTMTAVPGDGKVTLYWDHVAESSFDISMPIGHQYDFEGYKVYRATDYAFLENYTITDGRGRKVFHKPIAQFDLDNGNAGYFPQPSFGFSYYLGDDTGIQHVWTDTTVENGQRYYYAVTAYDHGYDGFTNYTVDDDGDTTWTDHATFFPGETSKYIFLNASGELSTDINTAMVTPAAPAAGYVPPVVGAAYHNAGYSNGQVYVEVVDPREVNQSMSYRFEFLDPDSVGQATEYSVKQIAGENQNVLVEPTGFGYAGAESRILAMFDTYFDSIYGLPSGSFMTNANYLTYESDVFGGLRAYMLQPRRPGYIIVEASKWYAGSVDSGTEPVREDSLLHYQLDLISITSIKYYGVEKYADYEIIFHDDFIDSSDAFTLVGERPPPRSYDKEEVNFEIHNLSGGQDPMFIYRPGAGAADNKVTNGSEIWLLEVEETTGDTVGTWKIRFSEASNDDQVLDPAGGDTLRLRMYKPFTEDDQFTFDASSAKIDKGKINLDRIKVYPNPYLGANSQEPANPYTSGRGEQRITFIHLPDQCTIRIYNIRGELVQTLTHYASIHDGSESWDMRNLDGLNIAYGVYIYHIDSPYGEHVGKFAVIK